jgi:hypothetical protein
MSLEQVLLTILITALTTIAVIAIAGAVLLVLITRKIKAQALAMRNRCGLPDPARAQSALVDLQKLAWLMDSSIPIGGGYRIGVDGLIDLIPGIGDIAGVLVSACIIYRAAENGVPQPVLMRMVANVIIDALLGAFPVVGAVADSAFKANERNVAIFQKFLEQQRRQAVIEVKPQR